MKKSTLIKLLCLVIACCMLLPMVIACGEESDSNKDGSDETKAPAGSTQGSTGGTNGSGVGGTTDSSNNAATDPSQGTTDPSQGTTDPSQGTTDPSQGTTDDPSEGTTDPSQGGTTGSDNVPAGETVTIAFRLNGGMVVNGANSVKIAKGGKLAASSIPEVSRTGYKFEYWSYTANGNDPIDPDDTFAADTALFAIWSEVTSDDSQGTTNSSQGTTDSSEGTTDSNEGTTKPSQGTTSSDNKPGDSENNKVVITFNGNNGSVDKESVEITKGDKLTYANVPNASRAGYTLTGWAYDPFGNEMWSARNDTFDSDTTLFAVWEKEQSGDTTDSSTNPGTPSTGKVGIVFDGNGGSVVFDYIEIESGSKLAYSNVPSATRSGYILKGWAYDPYGNEMWSARNDTFTDAETTLFAVWEKEQSGSTTDPSQGTTNSSGSNVDNPSTGDKVTIEFNTGTGYFEDANDYEMEIDKGGRIPSFPTPVHDNEAMVFDGWYEDAEFTVAASRSKKYDADAMLYAKWTEMVECSDGSYDHVWGSWDMDTKPDCKNAGKDARYCSICGNKQFKDGDPALGHLWNSWEEAFMRRERSCGRLGCTEKEIIEYQDVTLKVLGNTPGDQVEGSADKFYVVPFTNLINGRWDEGHGEFVGPKGNGAAHVQFNLVEATTLDRIYFKGEGVTSINVYVQYQGESDFTLVGVCSSSPDKESAPFVSPDATKNVVAIKFVEDNPPNGTSKWQEVAFVKVAEAE